jgi:hypothetical protein
MARRVEQRCGRAGLDDLAEVHDGDVVGDMLHHGKVVGDEDVGEAEPLLEVAQQVENLRADRNVERRDRFVAYDQLRLDRDGPCNGDALALATGKFVRIALCKARLKTDEAQNFVDALAASARLGEAVQRQRLGQRLCDGHARV